MVKKGSIDFALDVEASFFYPNKDRFFREITQVLKKDGTFIYGCFMRTSDTIQIEASLSRYFDIDKREDITDMTVKSLQLGTEKINNWIESDFPWCKKLLADASVSHLMIKNLFLTEGTMLFKMFEKRQFVYVAYLCKKKHVA